MIYQALRIVFFGQGTRFGEEHNRISNAQVVRVKSRFPYDGHISKIKYLLGLILREIPSTLSTTEKTPMNLFEKAVKLSDKQFLRAIGIDKTAFNLILEHVAAYPKNVRGERPMKKRGKKSEAALSDHLLFDIPR